MPPFMDFHPDQKLAAEALAQIVGTRHMRADQFGARPGCRKTGREMATRTRASQRGVAGSNRVAPTRFAGKETVC